ncbi:MAG: sigma-70 family RNA polymerase sigma factor [Flavobacteriales bacterium]|nr:sigma-70 family RNA polymerase sigma factor [Flavobacteriales bacterium]
MELGEDSHLSEKAQLDYKLVKLAIKGDQKAYASLMDRYRDSIYFLLLKMVNNRDDADDLTIEAFGKAFKNLEQYTPNFAFSTWLFKIASNNCIDFIRRKKKRTLSIDRRQENDDGMETTIHLKSDMLDPEEKFVKKQKIKLLHEIVKKLKPRYRELVELRYFKELSYEEIAQQLDIPLGTVKAQLFRAREFLQGILKHVEGKI